MSNEPVTSETRPVDQIWHEVEELIHEIDRRAREELSTRVFYTALVDRTVETLAASAGAMWLTGADGRLQVEYQNGLSRVGLENSGVAQTSHSRIIETVARSGKSRIVAPQSGSDAEGTVSNSTEFLQLLSPVTRDGETLGVIEIFQRPDTSPSAQQGFMRFLGALCELAADFHSNCHLRQMQDRSTLWGQFQQFAEKVHGSLDPNTTAYVLANEGRRLIGCDRVSVAVRRGSKYRLRAVSGLDTFDRRANLVRRLEKLIQAVTATGEPLWHTGDSSNLPPQIDDPLNEYLDESRARMLAVIPLTAANTAAQQSPQTDPPIGVLVVEQFDSNLASDALRQRTQAVCRQSAPALKNSLEHQSIPLLPLLKLWRKTFWFLQLRQLPKTAAVLVVLATAILAMVLVPSDFEISGTAELQPKSRRDIFASSDGIVREVLVEQKSEVSANEVVVRLRNSDLDFKISEVGGDLQTTQKELDTATIYMRSTNPNDPQERLQYNQLAAREVELKVKLKSLEKQLDVLQLQLDELEIRSPLDGQVLTWDLHKTLDARPVKRGQILMTVADVDGPWVVEIKVADEHIGHVFAAQREAAQREIGAKLKVAFMLAADPGVTHFGTVERVATTTEPDEIEGPTVLVTVRFDKKQITGLRPGASVVPRIYCGQRSIGYVWFHELIEAVQTRLLF